MSDKYINPSGLARYDSKIKEYIDNKVGSGTGNSSDDINLVSIDLNELISSEKTPEDVFPVLDGLCVRISTLAEGDDAHYPEYGMGNHFIKEEELFLPVKFSEWYDDGNSYRYNLYEFASPTHKLSIGYYETGEWQLTFDADKSGDYWAYKIEAVQSEGQGYDDTELVNRVATNEEAIATLETNLGGHTVESDVPADAKFTDTTNFLPLAGGTMDENAKINIPSKSLGATITLKDEYLSNSITPDGIYIYDSDTKESSWVGASSISSPKFNGDLEGKVNGYTIGASVPANAKFTDTIYDDTVLKTELTAAIATAKSEAIETVLGENVDADFDTLQEVANWIQSDTTNSAALVTRVTNAETDIDTLEKTVANKVDKVSGKGLSTNDLTATLKSNYDAAYTHSTSTHAPSTAEKNVIVGIQKNGTDLTPNSSTRKVNITVPTKTSELTNDSGFKTTDTVTTVTTTGTGNAITAISATNGAVTATKGSSFLSLDGGTVTGVVKFSNEEIMTIDDWGIHGNGNQALRGFTDVEADYLIGELSGNAETATVASYLGEADKGSATQPIYLDGGSPVACTYTLGKSVPSNAVFTDTTYSNFVKSGSGAKAGLVPAPSTTAGTTKYLREDGTWATPPDNNTTYSNMTAATSSAAGKAGLVPAPAAGAQGKFLRGDGTWQTPTNTTYSVVSTTADGLAPKRDGSTTKFLRGDGTWAVPPTSSVTVDSALSSTSTNPVQNKVINTALAGKAASNHTHSYLPLSGGTLSDDSVISLPATGGISSHISLGGSSAGYTTNIYPAEFRGYSIYGTDYRLSNYSEFGMKYGTGHISGNEGLLIGDLTAENNEWTMINNDAIAENNFTVYGTLYQGDESSGNAIPYISSAWNEKYEIGRGYGLVSSSSLPNDNLNYWYMKFSNGIMIIGFTHALQGLTMYHTIYFPVSFVNSKYAILINDHSDTPSNGSNCSRVYYQNKNYFGFYTANNQYQHSDYAETEDILAGIAIGRWK